MNLPGGKGIWTSIGDRASTWTAEKEPFEATPDDNWEGPATGFSIASGATLSEATEKGIFKKEDFNQLSALILGLQELKGWIREVFNQIIMAIKSLSLLFSGQLKLSIMKSGIIMLVIDLIAFCKAIYKLITDFDASCDDSDAEIAAEILNEIDDENEYIIIGGRGDSEIGMRNGVTMEARNKADGTITEYPIRDCSLNIAEVSKNVTPVMEALEKHTETRRAAWGI